MEVRERARSIEELQASGLELITKVSSFAADVNEVYEELAKSRARCSELAREIDRLEGNIAETAEIQSQNRLLSSTNDRLNERLGNLFELIARLGQAWDGSNVDEVGKIVQRLREGA